MNVSGIIVKTAPEHLGEVMAALEASGLCEIHFHDPGGKILVTVEGEREGEDVRKMREITNLPHVLCVDLAYSCQEDEQVVRTVNGERIRKSAPDALK